MLTAGVYTFDSDITINDDVIFSGAGVYIIQTTGSMLQADGEAHTIFRIVKYSVVCYDEYRNNRDSVECGEPLPPRGETSPRKISVYRFVLSVCPTSTTSRCTQTQTQCRTVHVSMYGMPYFCLLVQWRKSEAYASTEA
jgi:hypothetical protein